jgi:hypothetical protein
MIGKNRVYRIMNETNLLVSANTKLRAKHYSTRSKPRAKIPNQYWGMDMTKIRLTNWIQAYNTDYPHQSLRYKTSLQTMQNFNNRKLRKEVSNRTKH